MLGVKHINVATWNILFPVPQVASAHFYNIPRLLYTSNHVIPGTLHLPLILVCQVNHYIDRKSRYHQCSSESQELSTRYFRPNTSIANTLSPSISPYMMTPSLLPYMIMTYQVAFVSSSIPHESICLQPFCERRALMSTKTFMIHVYYTCIRFDQYQLWPALRQTKNWKLYKLHACKIFLKICINMVFYSFIDSNYR